MIRLLYPDETPCQYCPGKNPHGQEMTILPPVAAWLLSIITTGMTTANWLPATQFCVLGVLLIVSIVATNFIYSRTQR